MTVQLLFIGIMSVGIILCLLFVSSAEMGMGGLAAIAALLALQSYMSSEKAFKQTEKTLNKTETEQKIRDIERSLALFYYPLRDYLDEELLRVRNPYLKDENKKAEDSENKKGEDSENKKAERALERYNEISKNIAPHRYLATLDTRLKFEKLRLHGYFPRNRHETGELSDAVENDLKEKEKKLNNLKTTLKELEAPVEKKK